MREFDDVIDQPLIINREEFDKLGIFLTATISMDTDDNNRITKTAITISSDIYRKRVCGKAENINFSVVDNATYMHLIVPEFLYEFEMEPSQKKLAYFYEGNWVRFNESLSEVKKDNPNTSLYSEYRFKEFYKNGLKKAKNEYYVGKANSDSGSGWWVNLEQTSKLTKVKIPLHLPSKVVIAHDGSHDTDTIMQFINPLFLKFL